MECFVIYCCIFHSLYYVTNVFSSLVARKFDLPTMDIKVFDDSKTEVDQEAFEYLVKQPDLGVLELLSQRQFWKIKRTVISIFFHINSQQYSLHQQK